MGSLQPLSFLFFFLPLLSTANICGILPSSSFCSTILPSTTVLYSSTTINTTEAIIYQKKISWDFFAPPCKSLVAWLTCTLVYPPCDSSSNETDLLPCDSVCRDLTLPSDANPLNEAVCSEEDIHIYHLTQGEDLEAQCDGLPSTACSAPTPDELQAVVLPPSPTCQEYKGICQAVKYPIYVRPGYNVSETETYLSSAIGFVTLISEDCAEVMTRFVCSFLMSKCETDLSSQAFNYPFPREPVFPSFACRSLCEEYLNTCESIFLISPKLRLDCTSSRCAWIKNLTTIKNFEHFPIPCSYDHDWETHEDFPVQSSVITSFSNVSITSKCNDNSEQISYNSTCFWPLTMADPDADGFMKLTGRNYGGSRCDLSCPLWIFTSQEWSNGEGLMWLSIPSLIMTTFLIITFLYFPEKKTQRYVFYFILNAWISSLVLAFAFAVPGELRSMGCLKNVVPAGISPPSYCAFQSVVLFYTYICQSCWWLIITVDLFLGVVYWNKLTLTSDKRLHLAYHSVGWGLPLLILAIFLGAGGKLGNYLLTYRLFCWFEADIHNWSVYLIVFVPVGMMWVAGATLTSIVIYHLNQASKMTARTDWRIFIRPAGFVLTFLVINFWLFYFSIQMSVFIDDFYQPLNDWVGCVVARSGDSSTCQKLKFPSIVAWYGFHAALSTEGIILGLIWGTQKENLRLWSSFYKTKISKTSKRAHSKTSKASSRGHSVGPREVEMVPRDEEPVVRMSSAPITTDLSPTLLDDTERFRMSSAPLTSDLPSPSSTRQQTPPVYDEQTPRSHERQHSSFDSPSKYKPDESATDP